MTLVPAFNSGDVQHNCNEYYLNTTIWAIVRAIMSHVITKKHTNSSQDDAVLSTVSKSLKLWMFVKCNAKYKIHALCDVIKTGQHYGITDFCWDHKILSCTHLKQTVKFQADNLETVQLCLMTNWTRLLLFHCLSAMGVIPNKLNQSLTTFSLLPSLLSQVQKVVVLNTCSTVRKFCGVYLPEEADNH